MAAAIVDDVDKFESGYPTVFQLQDIDVLSAEEPLGGC
jgi:hypothetical protein